MGLDSFGNFAALVQQAQPPLKREVPVKNIEDMANIIKQVAAAEENAPSNVAPKVITEIREFMHRLTFLDCENFAREVRRMMDDVSESRMKEEQWNSQNPFTKYRPEE